MDYQQLLGVTALAHAARQGQGVKIAILDSGTPNLHLHGGMQSRSLPGGEEGRDDFGHASEVASALFGCDGIKGVCPSAEPYYVKVLDARGNGSVRSVVRGIRQAMEQKVEIINLSLGFARTDVCPRSLEKACLKAHESGIAILCAAGNDGGRVNWPAALPTTICVGASGANGLKAAFSSRGEVDFLAPGVDLSVRDGRGVLQRVSGTSFATALTTGVAALLMARRKLHGTAMSPSEVREGLKGLAQDIESVGWDETSGYGVIAGRRRDATVGQKMEVGFFGRILSKIQGVLGLGRKGVQNGRV